VPGSSLLFQIVFSRIRPEDCLAMEEMTPRGIPAKAVLCPELRKNKEIERFSTPQVQKWKF
jgi:hypothetical protein